MPAASPLRSCPHWRARRRRVEFSRDTSSPVVSCSPRMDEMSVEFLCQKCGKRLTLPDGPHWKKVRCPDCNAICEVAAPAPIPPTPGAPRTKPSPVSRPPPELLIDGTDDEDD